MAESIRRSLADDVVHRVTDDSIGDEVVAASGDGLEAAPVEALLTIIEQIVESGRSRGYVTAEELVNRTDELENADAVIDVITLRLAEIHVPVVATDEVTDLVKSTTVSDEIELFTNHVSDVDLSGISLDDPVRLYLREIGRVPLLTGVQEVTLAQAMERGDYLYRIRRELCESNPGSLSPTVVARVIYERFHATFPIARALYEAAFPHRPAATKQRVLADVLPLTLIPEHAIAVVAEQFEISPETLEETLRAKRIEFDLLPAEVQSAIEPIDNWLDDDTLVLTFELAESS